MKKKTVNIKKIKEVVHGISIMIFSIFMGYIISILDEQMDSLTPQIILSIMTTFSGFALTALVFTKNSLKNISSNNNKTFEILKKGANLLLVQFIIILLFILSMAIFQKIGSIDFFYSNLRAFILFALFALYIEQLSDLIIGIFYIIRY